MVRLQIQMNPNGHQHQESQRYKSTDSKANNDNEVLFQIHST